MKQKSENLRKYKAFENMGKEITEETGVKKSGNKKISKKICEKLYFSIFAANT